MFDPAIPDLLRWDWFGELDWTLSSLLDWICLCGTGVVEDNWVSVLRSERGALLGRLEEDCPEVVFFRLALWASWRLDKVRATTGLC